MHLHKYTTDCTLSTHECSDAHTALNRLLHYAPRPRRRRRSPSGPETKGDPFIKCLYEGVHG